MNLDQYLTSRPDRCHLCGYHLTAQACTCPGSEWSRFVAAVRQAARPDGKVYQDDLRPLIRGRIEHKHIGGYYRRAKAEGLLTEAGHKRSNDHEGRNAGRMEPYYELGAMASERAA